MPTPAVRPVVLIVRDGWGHNPDPSQNPVNAVHLARTPVDDRLRAEYPHVLIRTSGEAVGLPPGVMGNSEVGHQNIGAGRVVYQEVMRITRAIRDGSFFQNPVLCEGLARVRERGGRLHVIGLCSDAGVHSMLEHMYALLEAARRNDLPRERVFVHAITDGRDAPPDSGLGYIEQIEHRLAEIGVGAIASVIGRYYAMDRDGRWDRVEKAYRMLTEGAGERFPDARSAVQHYYEHPTAPSMAGDEFITPSVIVDERGEPRGVVRDGDAVIFFNFRGDRPRELCQAFVLEEFPFEAADRSGQVRRQGFERRVRPRVDFMTMTGYEEGLPVRVLFDKPPKMANILGEYVSRLGLTQFRCAETEKYPHVTFFFNDYREEPFAGEDRQIIPSPRDVPTYDLKPEMSAPQVTDEVVRRIDSGLYDLVVMNYANGDMVGHTGNLAAAVRAIEAVDAGVGRVVEAALRAGGALLVTADHGNAEQMVDPATGGPHTAHTHYDVDCIVVDGRFRGRRLREGAALCDLAPTLLEMMGIDPPAEMTGRSLLAS